MTRVQSTLRLAGALVLVSVLTACGTGRLVPGVSTPVAPTASVAQAEERLAAVGAERAAIDARHAEREIVCYDKFFVNNCLEEAKERRRLALAAQRAIEVEAEYFIRKNKVEERDKALAAAEAKFQAEEAGAAARPPASPKAISPVPPPRPSSVPGRVAKRDARAAQEPANAATRAANAAAFEERRRKSEERQREVAQRKAEREAKRAAQQAEKDKAAAAAKAPVPVK